MSDEKRVEEGFADTKNVKSDSQTSVFEGRNSTFLLTNEQFDKLLNHSSSSRENKGHSFGSPTPLGVLCFLICLTNFSVDLLKFHKADPVLSPIVWVGGMYFAGGLSLMLVCIMEWVLGNTYVSVVFGSFGSFWLSFGFLMQPSQGIANAFPEGALDPAYNSSVALYLTFWAIALLVYSVAALTTNICIALLLWIVSIGVFVLAGAYYQLANGVADVSNLLTAAGAINFVSSIPGWYFFLVLSLQSTGFPLNLPVGDLSKFAKQKST